MHQSDLSIKVQYMLEANMSEISSLETNLEQQIKLQIHSIETQPNKMLNFHHIKTKREQPSSTSPLLPPSPPSGSVPSPCHLSMGNITCHRFPRWDTLSKVRFGVWYALENLTVCGRWIYTESLKRKVYIVFQPSLFQGELLNFGSVISPENLHVAPEIQVGIGSLPFNNSRFSREMGVHIWNTWKLRRQ